MKNKRIGNIILHGGTIEDIQKEFPDFPKECENIIVYLLSMGYAKSTAKRYVRVLNSNSTKKSPSVEEGFFYSNAPNFDNILVDTCALKHKECLEFIDNAKTVTFTTATLEELDKKMHEYNPDLSNLKFNARKYMQKILEEADKFMIARYSTHSPSDYVDTILLEYLRILPKQICPTLLTADRNLAVRAKSEDFEYIFYKTPECQKTDTDKNNSSSKEICLKSLGLGIRLYKNDSSNNFYIRYTGTYKIKLIRGENEIGYCNIKKPITVNIGDVIQIECNYKGNITIKEVIIAL